MNDSYYDMRSGGESGLSAQTAQTKVPETKRERFLRLAPQRVQAALDALERVSKLALPENEYNDHEITQIVIALRNQVDEVEHRLLRDKGKKKMFTFASRDPLHAP